MKIYDINPNIECLLVRSRNEIVIQLSDLIADATGGPQNDEVFTPSQIIEMVATAAAEIQSQPFS